MMQIQQSPLMILCNNELETNEVKIGPRIILFLLITITTEKRNCFCCWIQYCSVVNELYALR